MSMDFATIGIGLRRLAEYLEAPLSQIEPTAAGRPLMEVLRRYNDNDFTVHDTVVDIQPESGRGDLNALAASHGFDEPFGARFEPEALGLLSIVDKKMRWHTGTADKSVLVAGNGARYDAVEFELSDRSASQFLVHLRSGATKPVVRIAADPNQNEGIQNYMWATELPHGSVSGFNQLFEIVAELIDTALADPDAGRDPAQRFASITLPMLHKITYSRKLTELAGAQIAFYVIADASQDLRVTIDEVGAEAAAMIAMTASWGVPPPNPRQRIVLGDTGMLLAWFTEADSRLPICATLTEHAAYTPRQPTPPIETAPLNS